MAPQLDPTLIRHGRVNGRYFRENFAQGGIDLVQIIPELVTNADSAIAVADRGRGRIALSFGAPEPAFAAEWKLPPPRQPTRRSPGQCASSSRRSGCIPARTAACRWSSTRCRYRPARASR